MRPEVALDRLVRTATAAGHLPECPRPQRLVDDCEWCRFALLTPEVEHCANLGADAVALREAAADQLDTVAWVVAATEVMAQFENLTFDSVRIPGARRAADLARAEVAVEIQSLDRVVDRVVAPGATLDQRCCTAAGAMTAAVLRSGEEQCVPRDVPAHLLQKAADASAALSAELQVTTLLPLLEHLQWRGLPRLITQPEWDRRPAPLDGAGVSAAGVSGAGLGVGSLEALVVESVVDRCTDEFLAIGEQLSAVRSSSCLRRSRSTPRMSPQTRRTVWRRIRVDWSLTLVDTGRAACWSTRSEGDDTVVDVPWTIATSVRLGARHGLSSAVAL